MKLTVRSLNSLFRKGMEIEQLENEQFEKFAGRAVGYVVELAVRYLVAQ